MSNKKNVSGFILLLHGLFLVILLLIAGVAYAFNHADVNGQSQTQIEPPEIKIGEQTPLPLQIKAAQIQISIMHPGSLSYVPDWASILHGMGVNALRLQTGGEGDIWGLDMKENSDWADNLEDLLHTIDEAGFKCWFQSLGDPWGNIFGLDDLNLGAGGNNRVPSFVKNDNSRTPLTLAQGKEYIDKLANIAVNSQNHDFINDPRILFWSIGNECLVGKVNGAGVVVTNDIYDWIIGIDDYIQSLGGKVVSAAQIVDSSAYGGGDWDDNWEYIVPLFEGHVDYIELHQYGAWYLTGECSLGGETYDWPKFKAWLQSYFETQLTNKGAFSTDQVILGEFGMYLGSSSDATGKPWIFTSQNRYDYYTAYFEVLNTLGAFKNIAFFTAFESTAYPLGGYGLITAPEGILLAGCEVITANYGTDL
jgi:hypothetical protein